MRILHVVPSYLPATRYGGPIYSVHGLAQAQAVQGHSVTVFTTAIDGPHNSPVPLAQPVNLDGVLVWYFPAPYLRRLFYAPTLLHTLRQQIRSFDVVHLHSVFLWPTWAAARVARAAGVPYVLAPRGMLVAELIRRKSYWLKTAWIACIERRNLEHAAALHATTALEAEQLAPFGFKLRQMTVIPNGVSPLLPDVTEADLPPAVRALPATTPLVLFLGRVHWKKGLDRLIPAMAAVPSACLVVAGNDEENAWPALAALAERVGLTPRLLRLEPQHGRAKQALYQRAQVFALPSYSENFGITVIEALQVGCPVVLTQEVGVAASVLRADCGLVCSGEPLELAAALQRVLTDAALRLELGARGKALIQNEFIWDALAKQTLTLYESLRG